MRISAETVDHADQRYDTAGDYQNSGDDGLVFAISKLGDADMELCVFIHELVEAHLCKRNGVSFEKIDEFDLRYEVERIQGDDSEPGDDPTAPYYREHQAATTVERVVAAVLRVDWESYEAAIANLGKTSQNAVGDAGGAPAPIPLD